VAPERRQPPGHDQGMFSPSGAGARTQGGQAQGVRRPCDHAARQRARVLRVMLRARPRLLARRRSLRVVSLQDQGGRGRGGAGDAMGEEGPRAPRAVVAVAGGRQPGARWGPGPVVSRLPGRPFPPACAPGGTAATLGVLGVCRPRGAVRAALGHEGPQRMLHRGLRALRMAGGGATRGQPPLAIHPPQQEGATVRGPSAPLAIRTESLPGDGRKTPVVWATIGQKQTSCSCYGRDGSRRPFSQRRARGLCFFRQVS
jgi:hypothetical protein